jgi:AcrR family transcriptional regulator
VPDASSSPQRESGLRSRAGNGMNRSRAGILAGAARCVARYGTRKTTMGDIAREGGVAKATLYNHFRTKDDVYAALVALEVERLLEAVATTSAPAGSAESVLAGLEVAARGLGSHPVVRRLAESEPALLMTLMVPSEAQPWQRAREEATRRLSLAQAAGALHPQHDTRTAVDTVLRWVVSHAVWPADPASVRRGAAVLVAGLRDAPAQPSADSAHPGSAITAAPVSNAG